MIEYTTVKAPYTCSFTERKSEFITDIAPIKTVAEATDFIESVRNRHKKASHVVYAYTVTEGNMTFSKFSDDGEPAGTAGKPVFDVLAANALSDTVLTVTRYFGGILLGGGGLVRAYTKAAADGCRDVSRRLMRVCKPVTVTVPYTLYGRVAAFLAAENNLRASEPIFTEDVAIEIVVLADFAAAVIENLTEITNGTAKIVEYDEILSEFA